MPAGEDIARVVDEAYAMPPLSEEWWKVRVRSDSAAYKMATLGHWNGRGREFAVSADMTGRMKEAVLAVAEEEWHL